jgi:hypothetical protein
MMIGFKISAKNYFRIQNLSRRRSGHLPPDRVPRHHRGQRAGIDFMKLF